MFNTPLKTSLRAGVVALTLAGTVLTAAPVYAQLVPPGPGGPGGPGGPPPQTNPQPPFSLQFNFGPQRRCLSDRQIIAIVRDEGYRNVSIVRKTRSDTYLVGSKRGNWYEIRVDSCRGDIERERRVSRRSNGSFNFSFSF